MSPTTMFVRSAVFVTLMFATGDGSGSVVVDGTDGPGLTGSVGSGSVGAAGEPGVVVVVLPGVVVVGVVVVGVVVVLCGTVCVPVFGFTDTVGVFPLTIV